MVVEVGTCVRCRSPLESGDLRCAICGECVPYDSPERQVVEVEVLRCQGCGASVEYDAERGVPACVYCKAKLEIESVVDPVEQTEGYLEFTITPAQARAGLKRWLGRRAFFHPGDLRQTSRVDSLLPIWWPAWVFDADASITWAADTDTGSGRSPWAPHAGKVRLSFDDVLVPATRGLSDAEALAMVPSYDVALARETPHGPAAARVERFDVQRSLARRAIQAGIDRAAADAVIARELPGRQHRKLSTASVLRGLETRRLSFPAYVFACDYKGRLYRVVVSGQSAICIHGKAPLSIERIALTAVVVLAILFLLFAMLMR